CSGTPLSTRKTVSMKRLVLTVLSLALLSSGVAVPVAQGQQLAPQIQARPPRAVPTVPQPPASHQPLPRDIPLTEIDQMKRDIAELTAREKQLKTQVSQLQDHLARLQDHVNAMDGTIKKLYDDGMMTHIDLVRLCELLNIYFDWSTTYRCT